MESLSLPIQLPPPPPPPPPPPAPEAPPSVAAPEAGAAAPAPVADVAVGLDGAGTLAAGAGADYGALPFEVGSTDFVGPLPPDGYVPPIPASELPPGEVRDAVVATATAIAEVSKSANRDAIESLRGTFSEAGINALIALDDVGRLDMPSPEGGPNLRDAIVGFLGSGGNPAYADAVVQQIAIPSQIGQINDNTCTAAAAQIGLAALRPAEYFTAATSLMTSGQATVRLGGQDINLRVDEQSWHGTHNAAAIAQSGLTGTDAVNAVVQTALMNFGSSGSYNFMKDRIEKSSFGGGGDGWDPTVLIGLSGQECNTLFDSLLKMPFSSTLTQQITNNGDAGETVTWSRNCEAELGGIRAALGTGAPGAYAMIGAGAQQTNWYDGDGNWPPSAAAHAVVVVEMKEGNVTFLDPHGAPRTCSETEFLGLMQSVDPSRLASDGVGGYTGSSTTGGGGAGRYRGGGGG